MVAQVAATPARAAARLGRSGWNAYSFNVDYRTGKLCSTWRCALLIRALMCQTVTRKQRNARASGQALRSSAARPS